MDQCLQHVLQISNQEAVLCRLSWVSRITHCHCSLERYAKEAGLVSHPDAAATHRLENAIMIELEAREAGVHAGGGAP
jgi:hypothetical protein